MAHSHQSNYSLRFGKYKGEPLDEVPTAYLCWALESDVADKYSCADAIRAELRDRLGLSQDRPRYTPSYAPARLPKGIAPSVAIEIVKAGRRSLSKVAHPDAGGDVVEMQRINAAYDWLSEHLAEVLA